jgi:hypothetical protein
MPLLDVPDITFRVTQDVDGDGDQDVIYAESHFDVRWNSGNIPDVTLYADPIAVAGLTCDTPEVPCENVPAITFAGLMPLVNPPAPAAPYHDAGSGEAPNFALGYARRPNRPHPNGLFADPPPNPSEVAIHGDSAAVRMQPRYRRGLLPSALFVQWRSSSAVHGLDLAPVSARGRSAANDVAYVRWGRLVSHSARQRWLDAATPASKLAYDVIPGRALHGAA